MSVLPTEVMHLIYQLLPGVELVRCRKVCRYWRDCVDSLSDIAWQRLLRRKHGDAVLNVKKTCTFKELYKSVALWADGEIHLDFIMEMPQAPKTHILQYQVLSSGLLSVLLSYDNISGNTIIYYNLESLEEVGREQLGFPCTNYSINEKYIAAVDDDYNLYILPNANKKKHSIGIIYHYEDRCFRYKPCPTEVYFKNMQNMLCVARLVKENNEVVVRTQELVHIEEEIVALGQGKNGELFMLILEIGCAPGDGLIYHYKDNHLEHVADLSGYTIGFFDRIRCYGFDLSSDTLLSWIIVDLPLELLGTGEVSTFCIHDIADVVIKGMSYGDIEIYYNDPYTDYGIHEGYADTIITISKLIPSLSPNFDIDRLLIVEKSNGHMVIATTSSRHFILHFTCKPKEP